MFGNLSLTDLITFMIVLVVSISIHEAMHAFTARSLGDTTADEQGRISLNPLRHIDPFLTVLMPLAFLLMGQPPILAAKPVPFRPDMVRGGDWGSALVAVAGPLTNFGLAIVFAFVFNVLPATTSDFVYNLVLLTVQLNVSLFVFNMIPFPPLDGSRVLYAVAPEPLRRVMETIESFGIFGVVILVVVLFPVISPILTTINHSLLRFLLV